MSVFYQSLSYWENLMFKRRKKAFKRGKPCAVCGKKYRSAEMMVAHIIPVRQLSDYDALYDTKNWEVRCIYCERRLNKEEAKPERKARLKEHAKKELRTPVIPRYELDIYTDYDELIQNLWNKAIAPMNMAKIHRRSSYWEKLKGEVKKADRLTLAKAAARFVMGNNGRMPTQEEIYKQLTKDVEAKMLSETKGKFKKEKSQK